MQKTCKKLYFSYCYGANSQAAPGAAKIYNIYIVPTIRVLIIPDSSTRPLSPLPADSLVAKYEKLGGKLPLNFAYKISLSCS
jgi:hypothetical protein